MFKTPSLLQKSLTVICGYFGEIGLKFFEGLGTYFSALK